MNAERTRNGGGARRWIRLLALPVACLVALVAYLLAPGGGAPALAACEGQAPQVLQIVPQRLGELREAVAQALPERLGRLYEEGAVSGRVAWSEDDPDPPTVDPASRRPAGYEMRWWAPDGDDVVADVFVFAGAAAAQRYLSLAGSRRCRARGEAQQAEHPARARDVSWVNPDGVEEVDVYVQRGPRVYRIADAPAQGGRSGTSLGRALYTVNLLACLLPDAGCPTRGTGEFA